MGASIMTTPQSAKSALVIIGDGVEELEAVAPIDLLRRAEVHVVVASREARKLVAGRNGIKIEADVLLDEIAAERFDCVVVPGGPGTAATRKDARVLELLHGHAVAGRKVAAICAAPLVLADAGLLEDKRYTGHASIASELPALAEQDVVVDGDVLTSRGAGTGVHFGLALVEALVGVDVARSIADAIHHPTVAPSS
jgi:4-methyl-5(b-hydroxyethyl)-thiazole monophosphate biosynthesis